MLKSLTLSTALALTAATFTASMAAAESDAVYTLSVQTIPEGAASQAALTRAGFLNTIYAQEGVEADHNFTSFFTFPEPSPQTVIVGFTEWENRQALGAAQQAVMSSPAADAYMQTVDCKLWWFC